MSDPFFRLIKHELEKSQKSIPKRRKSLERLLVEKEPSCETREGIHYFRKEELESLSKIVPKLFWGQIHLPIVLFAEEGGMKIMGSRYDILLVKNLSGKQKDFYAGKIEEHERFLESWQVAMLLEKYHSIFVFLFGL